jgi:hypothetical protein
LSRRADPRPGLACHACRADPCRTATDLPRRALPRLPSSPCPAQPRLALAAPYPAWPAKPCRCPSRQPPPRQASSASLCLARPSRTEARRALPAITNLAMPSGPRRDRPAVICRTGPGRPAEPNRTMPCPACHACLSRPCPDAPCRNAPARAAPAKPCRALPGPTQPCPARPPSPPWPGQSRPCPACHAIPGPARPRPACLARPHLA